MPVIITNRSSGGGPASSGGGNGSGGGANSGCATLVVGVVIILLLFALFGSLGSCTSCAPAGSSSGIAASTVEREALPASASVETGYYTDADGDWIHDPASLEQGLEEFYDLTGVRPYVYILPNGHTVSVDELTTMAEERYDELFQDEGHFLLMFCDDGYGGYNCGYCMGSQVKTVMDDEAIGILADYLDRYYNDASVSESQIFGKAFAETAKRIMTVTKSPVVPVAICVAVVVAAGVVLVIVKKRRDERERERRRTEDLLKTPLEKFGDDHVEDLAKKYESDSET